MKAGDTIEHLEHGIGEVIFAKDGFPSIKAVFKGGVMKVKRGEVSVSQSKPAGGAKIQIVGMRQSVDTRGATVVNTCNNNLDNWQSGLSPFVIGPCDLYGGHVAQNMENGWQYTKLYEKHASGNGEPTSAYWAWAKRGFDNLKAVRFPMGRGARPLHAWWDGRKLGYIEARKAIYGPLYAEAVQRTEGWKRLKRLYETEDKLILRDFDGYDHEKLGLSLTGVLNNPQKRMGHAFVLKMLLTHDPALGQLELRG